MTACERAREFKLKWRASVGWSNELDQIDIEELILAAEKEAVAAERERCIEACKGVAREVSGSARCVATALQCIAWIQGESPETALRVVELPGSSESGGRVVG